MDFRAVIFAELFRRGIYPNGRNPRLQQSGQKGTVVASNVEDRVARRECDALLDLSSFAAQMGNHGSVQPGAISVTVPVKQ